MIAENDRSKETLSALEATMTGCKVRRAVMTSSCAANMTRSALRTLTNSKFPDPRKPMGFKDRSWTQNTERADIVAGSRSSVLAFGNVSGTGKVKWGIASTPSTAS